MPRPIIERALPLADIEINRNGDGRTVTAYVATFSTPYPVVDRDGDYDENILPQAFNRWLSRPGQLEQITSLYNHGFNAFGEVSDRFSMPVGKPVEIKPDRRGLLTVTRYANTAHADEVLQLIKDGAITGMSFRGPVFRSTQRNSNGRRTIDRNELGLIEYGPTPSPANVSAQIVAVRSGQLLERLESLTDDQRAALLGLLQDPDTLPTTQPDEVVPVAEEASQSEDDAYAASLQLLEVAAAQRRRRDQ